MKFLLKVLPLLQYKDLSPAQRRWVELVEIYFPHIQRTITYSEIRQIHDFFSAKRAEDRRFKISKPLWIITHNAVSRGVYDFPGSGARLHEPESLSDSEAQYRTELAKYAITV